MHSGSQLPPSSHPCARTHACKWHAGCCCFAALQTLAWAGLISPHPQPCSSAGPPAHQYPESLDAWMYSTPSPPAHAFGALQLSVDTRPENLSGARALCDRFRGALFRSHMAVLAPVNPSNIPRRASASQPDLWSPPSSVSPIKPTRAIFCVLGARNPTQSNAPISSSSLNRFIVSANRCFSLLLVVLTSVPFRLNLAISFSRVAMALGWV